MPSCPYCNRYARTKQQCLDHMNKCHGDRLEKDQMDAAQALYFSTHGTIHGACMVCGSPTEWCDHTGKPYKVCGKPECRARLREQALRNHVNKYGKETLLDDMEHQKEMEKHRHTAGEYTFADGGKVGYLSKPELAFLKFCDTVMDFQSNMVQDSPEFFTYYDPKADKNRKYIPDYYLPDYNLMIEIKDGGSHPNTNPAFVEETKYKVALKDEVMRKQTKYNYIKIVDNNFGPFVELLYKIVHDPDKNMNKKTKKTMIVITETACKDPDEEVNLNVDCEEFKKCYLIIARDKITNDIIAAGICESESLARLYISDYTTSTLREVSYEDPIFQGTYIDVYHFVCNMKTINGTMKTIMQLAISGNAGSTWDILDILADSGAMFADKYGHTNNGWKLMMFIHDKTYNGGERE